MLKRSLICTALFSQFITTASPVLAGIPWSSTPKDTTPSSSFAPARPPVIVADDLVPAAAPVAQQLAGGGGEEGDHDPQAAAAVVAAAMDVVLVQGPDESAAEEQAPPVADAVLARVQVQDAADQQAAPAAPIVQQVAQGGQEEAYPGFGLHRSLDNIAWTWKGRDVVTEAQDGGSQKLTTNTTGGYQVMEEIRLVNIPMIRIPYDIEVTEEGNISVGALSHDQSSWIGHHTFATGKHSGVLEISTESQERVFLVVQSNRKDQAFHVTFNKLEVWFRE